MASKKPSTPAPTFIDPSKLVNLRTAEDALDMLEAVTAIALWALTDLGLMVEASGPRLAEEAAKLGGAHGDEFTEARLRDLERAVPRALGLIENYRAAITATREAREFLRTVPAGRKSH